MPFLSSQKSIFGDLCRGQCSLLGSTTKEQSGNDSWHSSFLGSVHSSADFTSYSPFHKLKQLNGFFPTSCQVFQNVFFLLLLEYFSLFTPTWFTCSGLDLCTLLYSSPYVPQALFPVFQYCHICFPFHLSSLLSVLFTFVFLSNSSVFITFWRGIHSSCCWNTCKCPDFFF